MSEEQQQADNRKRPTTDEFRAFLHADSTGEVWINWCAARDAFDAGGDTDAVLAFFVEQMNAEQSAQLKAALRKGRR